MSPTMDADVCIIGAGIAGLFAALSLPEGTHTMVVDKGALGEGSSPMAQGGMAAALGPDDSWQRHLEDTVRAGVRLVDEIAAEIVCREAPACVADLRAFGCAFDTNPDGSLHLAREGGQSVSRSVHRADATGAEMVRALRLAAEPRIERFHGRALRFAVARDVCRGVWAASQEGITLIRATHTLLATGGAGALFESTTNAPASTGDGIALAALAGAHLMDLEFVQFHPTALAVPESPRPLLTEALRGAGAVLIDGEDRRFMVDRHPDAELAPRHVVTAAILDTPEVFLDATSIGAERLEEEFPTVVASCRARGFDPATQPLPVEPAAHYLIGGVATDMDAHSSLPGLFAAGECAATGMHGANRMAGNSLSEAVVFARRAAEAMAGEGMRRNDPDPEWESPPESNAGDVDPALAAAIKDAVTTGAGPIRDGKRAAMALDRLTRDLSEQAEAVPGAETMRLAGELLVRAALGREESRGVHVRADFPETNADLDGVHFTRAITP